MGNNKFLDRNGTVLLDLTEDTVAQDKVVNGYTFHDKTGVKKTGNYMGIVPSGTKNLTDTSETDVAAYSKAQVVDANLVASNIKHGVVILGVTGSFKPSGTKALTTVGNVDVENYQYAYIDVANIANLSPANILKDVTILGVTGTLETGGGGGGTKQLFTPSISLGSYSAASDPLYIYNSNNGGHVEHYEIYKDGVLLTTVSANTGTVTVDLRQYISTDGTYSITVKATGDDMADSNASTAVSYTHYSYYTISKTLVNCTASNSATSITSGSSYSCKLNADNGYSFRGATIQITMGGVDITSTALTKDEISIANVTGNIAIVASFVAITQLSAPVITDTDGVLTWSAVTNAESYGIYANGSLKATTTNLTFDLHDLTFGAEDTYTITVTAQGDGYTESSASNSTSFEYVGETIDSTFGNNDWSVVFACDDPTQYWSLGDYKEDTINSVSVRVRIADLTAGRYKDSNNTNNHGVLECLWYNSTTQAWNQFYPDTKSMNSSSTNAGGWNGSELRTWVNGTFKGQLSSGLQAAITKTWKIPAMNGGNQAGVELVYSDDYIILASEKEIFGSASYESSTEAAVETRYGLYGLSANDNTTFRIKYNSSGTATSWWLRSACQSHGSSFCTVLSGGGANHVSANSSRGFVPFIPF